jgi:hypothetical protein
MCDVEIPTVTGIMNHVDVPGFAPRVRIVMLEGLRVILP